MPMLTTPAEYINYYRDILKTEFEFNDLKVDYHGFVGFIMNLFAMTNFDIKTYYDYLFKEGFLETCEENKNIYMHAAKYGYLPSFATPSTAIGNLIFDFSKLPKRPSNVYKREIVTPTNLQILINNTYYFTTINTYRFVEEVQQDNSVLYYCVISSPIEKLRLITSTNQTITVPLIDFKQHILTTYEYNTPNYEYGIYSPYIINIEENKNISSLSAFVKKYGSSSVIEYKIKNIKSFETSLSKVLFLNKISDKSISLEAGNGYHGEWIPNARVYVNVYLSDGLNGNLNTHNSSIIYNPNLTYITYNQSGGVLNQNTVRSGLITVDFHSSSGGTNSLTDNELKQDVIKWIQSRNNLINQNDFINVFSKYVKDFSILFKKHYFTDNTFYLYKTIRDQYQNLLFTTNYTYKNIKYDDSNLISNIKVQLIYNELSQLIPKVYTYKIVAVDKFYESVPCNQISVNITETNRSIVISWTPVENAEYYKVYGRTNQYSQYWVVNNTASILSGKIEFEDIGIDTNAIVSNINNNYRVISQVSFPQFNLNLVNTINLTTECSWSRLSNLDYTYQISNKKFYCDPSNISYDDQNLTKVSSVDQLITNSWTILDQVLYLKLDSLFDQNNSTIISTFTKELTFVSPFIYRYNSFLNWFEGYLINENQILYPVNTYTSDSYDSTLFYVNIVYNYTDNITEIYVKSYEDLADYTIKIKINQYDSDFVTLSYDQINKHFKHTLQDFIQTKTEIYLMGYKSSVLHFESIIQNVQQAYKINDLLTLCQYYDQNNNKYITNIPVLSYSKIDGTVIEYEKRDYISSQIFDYMVSSNISQNRMQSDTIQTRFLNTIFCDNYISRNLLKQRYDQNILLPLNISIQLKYSTVVGVDFATHRTDIQLLVAKYLQEFATGINISFYPSKIIDIIHSYNENIISVVVKVYDSYGTVLTDGLETIPEKDFLQLLTDKIEIIKYTSIYWWWNLDNILIEILT